MVTADRGIGDDVTTITGCTCQPTTILCQSLSFSLSFCLSVWLSVCLCVTCLTIRQSVNSNLLLNIVTQQVFTVHSTNKTLVLH